MDKRSIVKLALEWKNPPYVPWNINFTIPAKEKLQAQFPGQNLEDVVQNHLINIGYELYFSTDIGNDCVQDHFGVVWDRSIDKDIGVVKGQVLELPTLQGYTFPDPAAPYVFADVADKLVKYGDRYRFFGIGFSLYERAWTLRGLQTLLMDFYDHPGFVHDLFNNIADYNMYISTIEGKSVMKDKGANSKVIQGNITLDEDNLFLTWRTSSALPSVPVIKNCEFDFFNNPRNSGYNVPGPFQGLSNLATLQLFDGLGTTFR